MNQVCKNVEEKGKLLWYVLSRFRVDVSMESAFQFFFSVYFCFRSPLEVPALLFLFRWLFLQSLNMPFYFSDLIFFLIEIIVIHPAYQHAILMWNLDCHQFEEHNKIQTKCVIEFLFRQSMTSWTLKFVFDHLLKQ